MDLQEPRKSKVSGADLTQKRVFNIHALIPLGSAVDHPSPAALTIPSLHRVAPRAEGMYEPGHASQSRTLEPLHACARDRCEVLACHRASIALKQRPG